MEKTWEELMFDAISTKEEIDRSRSKRIMNINVIIDKLLNNFNQKYDEKLHATQPTKFQFIDGSDVMWQVKVNYMGINIDVELNESEINASNDNLEEDVKILLLEKFNAKSNINSNLRK